MGKKAGGAWSKGFGEGFEGFPKNNEWLKDFKAKILQGFKNAHQQGKKEAKESEYKQEWQKLKEFVESWLAYWVSVRNTENSNNIEAKAKDKIDALVPLLCFMECSEAWIAAGLCCENCGQCKNEKEEER